MGLRDVYIFSSQIIYFGTVLGVICMGAMYLGRDPALVRSYTSREGRRTFLPLLVLGVIGFVSFLTALLLGQIGSPQMLMNLALTGVIFIGGAAVTFPMAGELESEEQRRPWSGSDKLMLVALAFTGFLWSVLYFGVVSMFTPVEPPEGSFISEISPGRPFEFLGFCCFALMAAVAEEVVFRGGVQGLLKPRLGTVPAIVFAALVFALGHGGYVTIPGVKEAQIFVLALLLGWTRERFGLGGAVFVHVGNNFLSVLVAALSFPFAPS